MKMCIRDSIMAIEQIDGLSHHFHMTKFFGGYIKKQVFYLLILDPEALGHVLHGCLQLTIASYQLFLQQRRVVRVGTFHGYRME